MTQYRDFEELKKKLLKNPKFLKAYRQEVIKDFIDYTKKHPDERFWQALRNWSGFAFIGAGSSLDNLEDTFYFENRTR